jgi:site-specific recombinase XerD
MRCSYSYTLSRDTTQIHNGLKINQLKEVLGHRRMETTYKYVHLDRTNLRSEMEQGAL